MEDLSLTFPISMVKREQRIVVGIATADNVDKSNEVIEFDASVEAFGNWVGNIREMHSPIAVGKAVNYIPTTIVGDDGRVYNAIQVEAYISRGAQDTWEKVLDGTLRAFSVGGRVLEKELDNSVTVRGRPLKRIKKYELGELSLVDNPANGMAVIDVVKRHFDSNEFDYVLPSDDCDIKKENDMSTDASEDMNLDIDLSNEENYAKVSEMDTSAELKLSLLKRFVNWLTSEPDNFGVDENVSDDVEKSVAQSDASTDSVVEAEETQMEDQMDIDMLKDALGSVFDQKLNDFAASIKEEVEAVVEQKIEEVTKSAEAKNIELQEKLDAADAALADQAAKVEALASSGAVKKSVDPDDDEDDDEDAIRKSSTTFWNNLYLPQELISALGYES